MKALVGDNDNNHDTAYEVPREQRLFSILLHSVTNSFVDLG